MGTDDVAEVGLVPVPRVTRRRRREAPVVRSGACKRGHDRTPFNTYRSGAYAACHICRSLQKGTRPKWIEVAGARVSISSHDAFYVAERARLRAAVTAAHTDRVAGATTESFMEAHADLRAFDARESAWYASVGVPPPSRRRQAAPLVSADAEPSLLRVLRPRRPTHCAPQLMRRVLREASGPLSMATLLARMRALGFRGKATTLIAAVQESVSCGRIARVSPGVYKVAA